MAMQCGQRKLEFCAHSCHVEWWWVCVKVMGREQFTHKHYNDHQ